MHFSLRARTAGLLLFLSAGVTWAGDGPPPSLSVSDLEFETSDLETGEITGSGPSVASDGYVGSFSWNYSIAAGSGSLSYYVIYEFDQYNWDAPRFLVHLK